MSGSLGDARVLLLCAVYSPSGLALYGITYGRRRSFTRWEFRTGKPVRSSSTLLPAAFWQWCCGAATATLNGEDLACSRLPLSHQLLWLSALSAIFGNPRSDADHALGRGDRHLCGHLAPFWAASAVSCRTGGRRHCAHKAVGNLGARLRPYSSVGRVSEKPAATLAAEPCSASLVAGWGGSFRWVGSGLALLLLTGRAGPSRRIWRFSRFLFFLEEKANRFRELGEDANRFHDIPASRLRPSVDRASRCVAGAMDIDQHARDPCGPLPAAAWPGRRLTPLAWDEKNEHQRLNATTRW